MSTTLYQFSGNRLGAIEWCDPTRGSVLVADSWRVEEGDVVGLERHTERFLRSVLAQSQLPENEVVSFLAEVVSTIPRQGSWFPRVELVQTPGGPTLRYRQRPAPAWSTSVVVALTSTDPRTTPLTKGPDLEALLALRQSVSASGAHEALIVNSEGILVEGAYSSLLVWRADDELVVTPSPLPRIPSVTEAIVREIAHSERVHISEQPLTQTDLEGREVWIVSALHGIRFVDSVVGGPELASSRHRRDAWQEMWWNRRHPLP